ncbi:hypothetical protein M9980_06395 [Sphingomonas donggukensis]|uniref:DUF883 family protein n=1 Tax=Sphingomonas donggukensis TaxID=2949093 RepID=A0ABY4U0C3_9SPHN|nr:hypothetical protein [Sphingomonas donggukensis]URW76819.1 hypothetical protein M9980_06395 [Sphingomonas donggukensis]
MSMIAVTKRPSYLSGGRDRRGLYPFGRKRATAMEPRQSRLVVQAYHERAQIMANDNLNDGTALDVEFTPESAPAAPASRFDATAEKARGARALVKDEAGKLGGQATDRIRAFADDGKARATGALGELAKAIDDAAGTIDDKVGVQFGGYARSASSAVSDFSKKLEAKDVDAIFDDAREFVRKSPGVAIGAAAAVGFVLARVLWSGVDANRDR